MRTWLGFAYVAFIDDAVLWSPITDSARSLSSPARCSRYIVGWHASRSLRTDLALHALEQALRRPRMTPAIPSSRTAPPFLWLHACRRIEALSLFGGKVPDGWKFQLGALAISELR